MTAQQVSRYLCKASDIMLGAFMILLDIWCTILYNINIRR